MFINFITTMTWTASVAVGSILGSDVALAATVRRYLTSGLSSTGGTGDVVSADVGSTDCVAVTISCVQQLTHRCFTRIFLISYFKLEIRSVERGICPVATLYSLAAAFQSLTLLLACSQFCLSIKTVGCHDKKVFRG